MGAQGGAAIASSFIQGVDSLKGIIDSIIAPARPTIDNDYAGFIKKGGEDIASRYRREGEPFVKLYTRHWADWPTEIKCDIYNIYNNSQEHIGLDPSDTPLKFIDYKIIYELDNDVNTDYSGISTVKEAREHRIRKANPHNKGHAYAFKDFMEALELNECQFHLYNPEVDKYVEEFGTFGKEEILNSNSPYIRFDKHIRANTKSLHLTLEDPAHVDLNTDGKQTNACEIVDFDSYHVGKNGKPKLNWDFELNDENWHKVGYEQPLTYNDGTERKFWEATPLMDFNIIYCIHDDINNKAFYGSGILRDTADDYVFEELIESIFTKQCTVYNVNDIQAVALV